MYLKTISKIIVSHCIIIKFFGSNFYCCFVFLSFIVFMCWLTKTFFFFFFLNSVCFLSCPFIVFFFTCPFSNSVKRQVIYKILSIYPMVTLDLQHTCSWSWLLSWHKCLLGGCLYANQVHGSYPQGIIITVRLSIFP